MFSIFLSCYAACYASKIGAVGDTTNFISSFQNMNFISMVSSFSSSFLPGQYGAFRFDAGGAYLNDYAFYRYATINSKFFYYNFQKIYPSKEKNSFSDTDQYQSIILLSATSKSSCDGKRCFDLVLFLNFSIKK